MNFEFMLEFQFREPSSILWSVMLTVAFGMVLHFRRLGSSKRDDEPDR